jgi:hypothetical protein
MRSGAVLAAVNDLMLGVCFADGVGIVTHYHHHDCIALLVKNA